MGGTVLAPAVVSRRRTLRGCRDPRAPCSRCLNRGPSLPRRAPHTGLGDFSWHELATTDWKAALSFYQKLFGWETTSAMDMGGGNTYQMFGWGKNTIGGMFTKPKEMPGPPYWLPYAVVSDSKRTAETIKKAGGKVINGPMEVPDGWIVAGIDLQGAVFAVHSKKPAAAAAPKAAAPKAAARKPSRPEIESRRRSPGDEEDGCQAREERPPRGIERSKPAKQTRKKQKSGGARKGTEGVAASSSYDPFACSTIALILSILGCGSDRCCRWPRIGPGSIRTRITVPRSRPASAVLFCAWLRSVKLTTAMSSSSY